MAGEHHNFPHSQPWNPGAGSQAGARAGAVMEKAKEAATDVADKAKDVASNVVDTAKDVASNVADTARDWASGAAHGAERAYAATRDTVVGAEETVETFIRRRPLESVLIAFGVGCLVGYALRRGA
jgi:ElaB/YqjD/DUF883 family membrane-anchored ribosome-binding protein